MPWTLALVISGKTDVKDSSVMRPPYLFLDRARVNIGKAAHHNAHVVAEKPKCTCRNACNEKIERQTRRAHVGGVSGQWEDGHDCDRYDGILTQDMSQSSNCPSCLTPTNLNL